MITPKLPRQRWFIFPEQAEKVSELITATGLFPLLAQVLINRNIETPDRACFHLDPKSETLPSPLAEFPDLEKSVDIIEECIVQGEKIAICGDYDADGMTSTALLTRALRSLGANVISEIPDRQKDGYGLNTRIVKKFAKNEVGLILTVDNGISALEAVLKAIDLGLSVIITDHHDLPQTLPPADAILNPKLLSPTSPYRGLAGVGVAYILASAISERLGASPEIINPLLELYTLGTIADLAPLVGINRCWLKQGLKQLPKSEIVGIKALMQVALGDSDKKVIKPDDIGFRLGPRINALGRIGEPRVIVDLLTTDDSTLALQYAMECEAKNRERQSLCEQIEVEAIELIREQRIDWEGDRVLVLLKENWHHGVIGIVASRLVDRYGVPVFICTFDETETIRGSARGIFEFNVFEALEYSKEILIKHGGHKNAGGFSLLTQNFPLFRDKLKEFSRQCLRKEHTKPLVRIDGEAKLEQLTLTFYQQIEELQPWGIENETPIFWTPNVIIVEQQLVKKHHLKMVVAQEENGKREIRNAIAWRWAEYFPLPSPLDIAYKISENTWNNTRELQLELVGVRFPENGAIIPVSDNLMGDALGAPPLDNDYLGKECNQSNGDGTYLPELKPNNIIPEKATKKAKFSYNSRIYTCSLWDSINELRIRNDRGNVLVVTRGQKLGLLGKNRATAKQVDVTKPDFYPLIKAAMAALGTAKSSKSLSS